MDNSWKLEVRNYSWPVANYSVSGGSKCSSWTDDSRFNELSILRCLGPKTRAIIFVHTVPKKSVNHPAVSWWWQFSAFYVLPANLVTLIPIWQS